MLLLLTRTKVLTNGVSSPEESAGSGQALYWKRLAVDFPRHPDLLSREMPTISEILLLDFDSEIAGTRRILERIPENDPLWKPHEKSMPIGRGMSGKS